MAELAHTLLRMFTRACYPTEHILVVDALIQHATLPDNDLASILGMNVKVLRKICGKLREDWLISVHNRLERRADGSGVFQSGPQAGQERMSKRDWYFINYHRAIDSIKYRIHKLNKYVESKGSSTTEKKDLQCTRCGSMWTELEVMDNIDVTTGNFHCRRCDFILIPTGESERSSENEEMKRLNMEFAKILAIMQQIDATTVPENDFEQALSKYLPIERTEINPGSKMEVVDVPGRGLQSTKGLEIKPEKIAVQVQDDADVKRETAEAEAAARREKEARQNALPDWIAKSTVSGDITAVGAKEERLRQEREAHASVAKEDEGEEKKQTAGDEDVMAAYWQEMAIAREKEAAEAREDEEDDDEEEEDDDEFEDVDVTGDVQSVPPPGSNGASAVQSSNASDDERGAKRVRIGEPASTTNGVVASEAASEEDEELEFEDA